MLTNDKRRFLIKELRTNQRIQAFKVQLIDEEGKKLGIIEREKALNIARERNYDLVEVSPLSRPPVCKLLDYAKHKYQQTKKEQKQKSKTKQKETKSIRLSARIGDHDLAVKLRQAEKFLTKGHRIKVILILKGREKFHSEQGSAVINNFIKSLVSKSRIEKSPFRERNLIWAILTPQK